LSRREPLAQFDVIAVGIANLGARIARALDLAPNGLDAFRLEKGERSIHVFDLDCDEIVAEMDAGRRRRDGRQALKGDELDRGAAQFEVDEIEQHAGAGFFDAVALAHPEAEILGVKPFRAFRLIRDQFGVIDPLEYRQALRSPPILSGSA
jgi:hypothetical protein